MNHSQEPWEIDNYDEIIADGDRLLLVGVQTPITAGKRMDIGKANARRIIACVNACAGIETSTLEQHALSNISAGYSQLFNAVRNLRDAKGRFYREQAMERLLETLGQIEELLK